MIDHDSSVTIHFLTKGTTIFVETHTPSQEELNTCQHIVLTHDKPWNPSAVELGINNQSTEEEENSRIVSDLSSIDRATNPSPPI